jgi:Family of unknown function (DUF6496)
MEFLPIKIGFSPKNHLFIYSHSDTLKIVEENVVTPLKKLKKDIYMAKYGKKAQTKVKKAMRKMKYGDLYSGKSHKKVTSRKQAIAIGLSEARKAGAKVPKRKKM